MCDKEQSQEFMNKFAEMLRIFSDFNLSCSQVETLQGFETIFADTINKLNRCFKENGYKAYVGEINMISAKKNKNNGHIIEVYAACINMDSKISYSIEDEAGSISMYSLIPDKGLKLVKVQSLNTNYDTTKIWINPQYDILSYHMDNYEKPLANRNSFEGLNAKLKHSSYVSWEDQFEISNIIIPKIRTKENLRISFAPMTNEDSLMFEEGEILKEGNTFNTRSFSIKQDEKQKLIKRYEQDWMLAVKQNTDIFFGPEMLCPPELFDDEQKLRDLVQNARNDNMNPPIITILPSCWKNGKNECLIYDNKGRKIESQSKIEPFINEKEHYIEALQEEVPKHITVIHIPGVCRIVIMICADFIYAEKYLRNIICSQIKATLILVPSYTSGEKDFFNMVDSLNCFGTTVIWGNSCAATLGKQGKRMENSIGACSIAGRGTTERFSDCRDTRCNNSCEGHRACIFTVDLPLKPSKKSLSNNERIKHFLVQ